MAEAVLETRHISKSFGALQASDDVSITVKGGEIHAIIGPNGAGKSTLIAQICGSLMPDSGSVHFLGNDVTTVSTRARARAGLARTFQVSALAMEDTVLQNVVLGTLGATGKPWSFFSNALDRTDLRHAAEEALEKTDLLDLRNETTSALSHGQRRQLEVAIALTLRPKLFVMDEPMAGLGAEGSKKLTGFLGQLKNEAPILLVEHDMDVVFALADRISVLVYGKIIATGSVEEIRANPDVQQAYLGEG